MFQSNLFPSREVSSIFWGMYYVPFVIALDVGVCVLFVVVEWLWYGDIPTEEKFNAFDHGRNWFFGCIISTGGRWIGDNFKNGNPPPAAPFQPMNIDID
jgi:hypothetical protein